MPSDEVITAWRRDRSAVRPAALASSGRSPAKAPRTSARPTGTVSTLDSTPSRKSSSAAVGTGTSTTVSTGSSVIPT